MKVHYVEPTQETSPIATAIEAGFADPGERVAIVTGLLPGEPIFAFRARDALTLAVLAAWRQAALHSLSADRLMGVNYDIAALASWRAEHPELVRDPD